MQVSAHTGWSYAGGRMNLAVLVPGGTLGTSGSLSPRCRGGIAWPDRRHPYADSIERVFERSASLDTCDGFYIKSPGDAKHRYPPGRCRPWRAEQPTVLRLHALHLPPLAADDGPGCRCALPRCRGWSRTLTILVTAARQYTQSSREVKIL